MILKSKAVNIKVYPNPVTKENVMIKPGNNDINGDTWKFIKDIPMVKRNIEAGIFVVGGGQAQKAEAAPNKKGPVNSLQDMSEKEAIATVEGTFDIKTLDGWKSSDLSRKIKSAITAQIKAIKK